MKTLLTIAVVSAVSIGATLTVVTRAQSRGSDEFDPAPSARMALFAAMEKMFWKMDGHAYVVTKDRVIPCYGTGPDDNAPLPCEAAVAESNYASCRDLERRFSVKGTGCDSLREKYEKARAAASFCGICGPTGPRGPL